MCFRLSAFESLYTVQCDTYQQGLLRRRVDAPNYQVRAMYIYAVSGVYVNNGQAVSKF